MTAPPPEQTARPALALALSDIKLAHSVFALPFALLAAFIARQPDAPWGTFGAQAALIVVCMVFARTWAMLINRLADRDIDRRNPRTARRALASGELKPAQGWAFALASAGAFVGTCAAFLLFDNDWPLILSLPVLAWIALYSYTKRFTALCHIFLGGALAASPIAAAIAVGGTEAITTPVAFIALFVVLWVAGFDVIYALQDLDFDRDNKLHSIPAALGWRGAIVASRVMHAGAFAALYAAWATEPRLGRLFLMLGLAPVAALLVGEHVVLRKRGKAGLDMAFFTLNGIISVVLGTAGILDLLF